MYCILQWVNVTEYILEFMLEVIKCHSYINRFSISFSAIQQNYLLQNLAVQTDSNFHMFLQPVHTTYQLSLFDLLHAGAYPVPCSPTVLLWVFKHLELVHKGEQCVEKWQKQIACEPSSSVKIRSTLEMAFNVMQCHAITMDCNDSSVLFLGVPCLQWCFTRPLRVVNPISNQNINIKRRYGVECLLLGWSAAQCSTCRTSNSSHSAEPWSTK